MSDPLQFTWESTPSLWRCYYDPEGPQGFGRTKEQALLSLFECCDGHHSEAILAGAIVAAIPETHSADSGLKP